MKEGCKTYKVIRKQPNSKMCLACGLENSFGLKALFYELENNEVVALFKPIEEYQSYPGMLHGGIAAAILDETIGRAFLLNDEEAWGFTIELNIHYLKPIPIRTNEEIKVTGRITKEEKDIFEGTGEIILKDGDIAAKAYGKYMILPLNKIPNFDLSAAGWKVIPSVTDSTEIEY
jgi:acyl-coenzyme A thioesterase PaaI-like protein